VKRSFRRYALLKPLNNLDQFWNSLQTYGWSELKQDQAENLSFIDEGPAPLSDLEVTRPQEGLILHFRACFDKKVPLDAGIRYDAIKVWEKENDRKITGDECEALVASIQGKNRVKRSTVDCYLDMQNNYLLIDGTESEAEDIYLAFFKATGLKARRETGLLILRHVDFESEEYPSTSGASLDRESDDTNEEMAAWFLAWCAGGYCPSIVPSGGISLKSSGIDSHQIAYSGKNCEGRADLALALLSPLTTFARGKFSIVVGHGEEQKDSTLTPTLEPAGLKLITGDEGEYSPMILDYWNTIGIIADQFKGFIADQFGFRMRQAKESMQRVITEASIYVRPTGQLDLWESACTRTERVPLENGAELRERARKAALVEKERAL